MKRRPSITAQVIKGIPRLVHEGARFLSLDKNLDSPNDRELRAAYDYMIQLHFWYREQTMNYSYSVNRGRVQARHQAHISDLKHPSPVGP